MYYFKPQQKPRRWGSFQDVQYAIRKNSEKIYGVNPDSDILVMPLFWGLPLLDYSGKANHGTNHGATYKDGSLNFNGESNYVEGKDIDGAGLFSELTVSCRVNLDTAAVDYKGILDKSDAFNSNVNPVFRLFLADNVGDKKFRWKVWGADGVSAGNVDSDSATINEWIHIVGRYDGSEVAMWINGGKQAITQSETGNLNDKSNNLRIGVSNSFFIDGLIDEVRISNIARTADQIALFHDCPWDLYRPVSRPIYSLPSMAIMNQFQGLNLGADLYNGTLL